jgi:hypothetical protein
MAAIVYLVASAIASWIWSRRCAVSADWAIRALAGLVIWALLVLVSVQAMAAIQIAGWVGLMHLWGLAAIQIVILAAVAWRFSTLRDAATVPNGIESKRRDEAPSPKPAIEATPTRQPDKRSAVPAYLPIPAYLWIASGVLACSYLVFATNLLSSYPSGWDALAYHLPVALRWLQSGSLGIPPSLGWQYGLPGNAEIGMMLLLSTGSQALAPLVNFFALAVLALSTYVIAARLVGGNRIAAYTATLVLLSLPMVEFQAFSAYVDLFGTAFLAAALALFLSSRDAEMPGIAGRPFHQRSQTLILLAALACGVSVGTKPVFWVYAAVVCLVVTVVLVRESMRASSELAKVLGLVVVGVLLPSVFWFGRSFEATGNPLFPMQVKIGERVLLKGFAPSQITGNEFSDKFVHRRAEWVIYPWTEWMRNPGDQLIPYSEGSGTGAAFAAFVPLGLLFAAYRMFTRRSRALTAVLLAATMGLAVFWWVMLQRMPRFGLPLLVLACVLTAPLLEFLQNHKRRAFVALFTICLIVTGGISAFVPLRDLGARTHSRAWSRCRIYGYPCIIDTLPAGTTLLNDTGIQEANFMLAGSHLSNHVIADFDVPNPITQEFLLQRQVDYVVEVVPEQGRARLSDTAEFLPATGASIESTIGRKRWQLWKVTGNHGGQPSKAASDGR